MTLDALALSVARCPDVAPARLSLSHPCHDIVTLQSADPHAFQCPEPWAGALSTARIAFVASNPSISEASDAGAQEAENYPRESWPDDVIADFMTRRFEGRWATPDGRFRRRNGRLSTPVRFWSAVQNRAEELLDGIADPTRDYVMTEVVHCKSRSEVGVRAAGRHCLERHLERILFASPAPLVVVLGSKARDLLVPEWDLPFGFGRRNTVGVEESANLAVLTLGGTRRVVAYLWHPTGMTAPKLFSGAYPRRLHDLRSLVRGDLTVGGFERLLEGGAR